MLCISEYPSLKKNSSVEQFHDIDHFSFVRLVPMLQFLKIFFTSVFFLFVATTSFAAIPITTDSRIKTFVYNENEVFPITVHYGYMTSVEFAKNETIHTIAPGNGYSWKFIQDGRRLFIKALEGAAHTNMTVITSKRTYQFELESKDPSEMVDEQLVYVVRFYYPDELLKEPKAVVNTNPFMSSSPSYQAQPVMPSLPNIPAEISALPPQTQTTPASTFLPPLPSAITTSPKQTTPTLPVEPALSYPQLQNSSTNIPAVVSDYSKNDPVVPQLPYPLTKNTSLSQPNSSLNYNYTLTGPDSIAPTMVYDDGTSTYLKFPNNNAIIPYFFTLSPTGTSTRASYARRQDMIVLDSVNSEIVLRYGNDEVHLYNEAH